MIDNNPDSNIFTLESLPQEIKEVFLKVYVLKNVKKYRDNVQNNVREIGDLFDLFDVPKDTVAAQIKEIPVIWATDNYLDKGDDYGFQEPVHDLSVIVPRSEKSKLIQKLRTKEKAEVFTPSWVCNKQNNLIDSATHESDTSQNKFNIETEQGRWVTTDSPVFPDTDTGNKEAAEYILRKVLEITCGEAPYLVSPYDTVTGNYIPVRDNDRYMRIGLLDRKLRIVSEVSEKDDKDSWYFLALEAMKSTYGYEWQGDNLLLARLNLLNTFVEYYEDFLKVSPSSENLLEVAKIISWNIWQMDGLKTVIPMSCSAECKSCEKKERSGHDGEVSLIKFNEVTLSFENMVK